MNINLYSVCVCVCVCARACVCVCVSKQWLMMCSYVYCVHSASDHIDFKATLSTVPQLPNCATEFPSTGPFNLDNLEVHTCRCFMNVYIHNHTYLVYIFLRVLPTD